MSKLKGKTAVITGGNSGIGFATAKLFLKEGATVIITGRNETAIKDAVAQLGKGAHGIVSDAGKMNDVNKLAGQVAAISSTVDILFANAGVGLFAPFEQTTEEVFDANMNINFKGLFFTVKNLLPLLPEGGSVILNASIVAHDGFATASAYSGSKGAVLSLGRVLAIELAAKNIRVNTVSPGPIETPIYGKLGIPEDALKEFAATIQSKVPLLRFGASDEVAQAVLFLASGDSGYITASEIRVDGGKSRAF